ncbi:glycosyltransferase [Dyadobacter psychrophilus]|uniref:Predicted glycosyl transferase n=1 Tax=Dyadobacter psychrophilus TaxID=651661 RepID=A0A1T5BTX5_9BACT|nr:glycosyltransferase [Dyadobacter psychrophilus]SKB50626.1 Predicted glycosyl transferase [Dyadobacter psychrophilus]
MSANFAFYIHHHGSGHLMRALSIASQLKDARVTFLGSGLSRFEHIIPKTIHCIHLPGDVAGQEDTYASLMQLSFLHYAPINVEKVARRATEISAALHALFPVILIVDVSVEVTMLATLCGIPTVVIRQNGNRDDAAHLHAYECAQLLVAPSPERLMNPSPYDWVNAKTFFSGGFSKYSGKENYTAEVDHRAVGVIVGSGGTSLDGAVVNALAAQCPDKLIHVIGDILETKQAAVKNVIFHGQLTDPATVLSQCDVVIGNAGHNTVMEMADLGKKFVCIPEDRPFQEQLLKAELLEKNGMAVVIQPSQLKHINWEMVIRKVENLPADGWQGVINTEALADIALRLHELWDRNFPQRS